MRGESTNSRALAYSGASWCTSYAMPRLHMAEMETQRLVRKSDYEFLEERAQRPEAERSREREDVVELRSCESGCSAPRRRRWSGRPRASWCRLRFPFCSGWPVLSCRGLRGWLLACPP